MDRNRLSDLDLADGILADLDFQFKLIQVLNNKHRAVVLGFIGKLAYLSVYPGYGSAYRAFDLRVFQGFPAFFQGKRCILNL